MPALTYRDTSLGIAIQGFTDISWIFLQTPLNVSETAVYDCVYFPISIYFVNEKTMITNVQSLDCSKVKKFNF